MAKRPLKCRKCGERIHLIPKPGFIVRGESRNFAVNADDARPHWKRCKINQELAAAKKLPRVAPPRSQYHGSSPPQGGLTGRSPGRSSGEPPQGDLFDE
jgi:hypothetical protein